MGKTVLKNDTKEKTPLTALSSAFKWKRGHKKRKFPKSRNVKKYRMGGIMKKKYTLKVFPAGAGREVYRIIEISGEHSLDDLCRAILSAFEFIDEHLYEFCMDNRMYGAWNYQSDP